MNDQDMVDPGNARPSGRPLWALFLMLVVPLLAGTTISPWIFHGLQWIGQHTDALSKLTEARFERVNTRCVMLIALIVLVPSIRMSGLMPDIQRAWILTPPRRTDAWVGLLIGAFSIGAIYQAGYLLGAFVPNPRMPGVGRLSLELLEFILGAVFIGVFEETFFRGLIFGALRKRMAFMGAWLLSSAFFSFIHFLRPRFPEPTADISWYSGYELFSHMFALFRWADDWPFAVTLFVMGLTLAAFYEKRGSFYLIAGLHAGWVVALRFGSLVLDRDRDVMSFVFDRHDVISKAPVAIPVILLFLVAGLLTRGRAADKPVS